MEALKPFIVANTKQDPPPMKHLHHSDDFNFDIELAVSIKPKDSNVDYTLSKTNFKYLYWTIKQQLAHHASNGCNIRPGDLMGSGTISGPNFLGVVKILLNWVIVDKLESFWLMEMK
ncbi:unnamed protein product [Meloidogyne enterolobii]|uniref:Uncharacterized protein n=1 Tax=Meloidogyne enterolobii TaxID=390850 RepID=A0ACB0YEG8_MELEN